MALLRPIVPSPEQRAARLLGSLGVLLLAATGAWGGTPSEYEVKGAFLYNFAKFVEWPAEATADRPEFVICVMGSAEVVRALEGVVEGRSVDGRPVAIRAPSEPVAVGACHIVFATGDESPASSRVQAPRGVLTVGESQRFAREGGMINFVRVDKKVRFEINKRRAGEAGLAISSHLLKLAHDVIE